MFAMIYHPFLKKYSTFHLLGSRLFSSKLVGLLPGLIFANTIQLSRDLQARLEPSNFHWVNFKDVLIQKQYLS